MNRFDEAREDYERAAAINPASYTLQLRLSDFYRNSNGFDSRDSELALQHAQQPWNWLRNTKAGGCCWLGLMRHKTIPKA